MKKFLLTVILLFAVVFSITAQTASEWFERGNNYFNSGNYTNAITAYTEAIKRDSTDLDAYYYRSAAYYMVKNYDACIADCTTVINGAPAFPGAYITRGDAYGAKGIYHKAVADYREGLDRDYNPNTFGVDKSSKADMWFCGAIYMEILRYRYLGNTAAVTRYENWLRTVQSNNSVTRVEVETFYRNNISGLVSSAVDEEFNKLRVSESTVHPNLVNHIKTSVTAFLQTPNQVNFNELKTISNSVIIITTYKGQKLLLDYSKWRAESDPEGWRETVREAEPLFRELEPLLDPAFRAIKTPIDREFKFNWEMEIKDVYSKILEQFRISL